MAGNIDDPVFASSLEAYENDKRPVCKYGTDCYQKNRTHVDKYKHPPKTEDAREEDDQPTTGVKRGPSPAKGNNHDDSPKKHKRRKERDEISSSESSSDDCVEPSSENINNLSEKEEIDSDPIETERSDESAMPASPTDIKENIKQKFLFEMPEDFYSFWEFCKSLSKDRPAYVLKDVGLQLVGPYDVLSGALKVSGRKRDLSMFLLHWRYYFDPPEFQTVLRGNDSQQFHIGYFRDEPKSLPVFLASNCAAKDGVFTQVAENIFGAVNAFIMDTKKTNPFILSKIPKLQKPLQEWAKEHGFTLETKTQAMRQRNRKMVSKTFHGLGLVVPVEKRTEVGYRELIETDANLKRILRQIINSTSSAEKDVALDKLQPIITAANIANDEGDFGTSVELGLDLFSFGGADLERYSLQLLTTGYNLIGRKEFAKIVQAHLANRRKEPLSI